MWQQVPMMKMYEDRQEYITLDYNLGHNLKDYNLGHIETNPTQIGKLMHIHRTNSSPPLSQFKVVNRAWAEQLLLFCHDTISTLSGLKSARLFYKEFITRFMRICHAGKDSLNKLC